MSLFPDLPLSIRVLDLSAGQAAVWFGARPKNVVAVDRRACTANCLADTRYLPFRDASFDLAVFDPPHTNFGPNSNMAQYGHSTMDEIRDLIRKTSAEAARCVRAGGLMALKWNDRDVALTKVLGLMPAWRPLFGHGVSYRQRRAHHTGVSQTAWVLMLNEGGSDGGGGTRVVEGRS